MIQDIIYILKKEAKKRDKIVRIDDKRWFVVTTESGLVGLHKIQTTINKK
jgi:hypothetical protein